MEEQAEPAGETVTANAQGADWTVTLSQAPQQGPDQVKIARDDASATGALSVTMAGATHVFWVADPSVGDRIGVVTALAPAKGLASPRQYVDLALLTEPDLPAFESARRYDGGTPASLAGYLLQGFGLGMPVQEIDLADTLRRLKLKQIVAQLRVHVPAVDEGSVLRLVRLPLEGDQELARQRLVARMQEPAAHLLSVPAARLSTPSAQGTRPPRAVAMCLPKMPHAHRRVRSSLSSFGRPTTAPCGPCTSPSPSG
jgi:hypothetical protein